MSEALPHLARLYHTVRHLRPVQVYGRLWFRLYKPRPDLKPAPKLRTAVASPVAWAARPPKMHAPETFWFLNHEGTLESGWDTPHFAKLWRYNLHYFDDLNTLASAERVTWHRALLDRWIAENPPGQGSGWEPYPLSLRIVNWIKWQRTGNQLEPAWLQSLAIQVRYLAARLEYHLLGNHLFVNAKALVVAGLFFEGREAERWLTKGLALLARECKEQILADGGHFERSPMYHALILEDLLDLLNLSSCYDQAVPAADLEQWQEIVGRMRRWLAVMTHPDGGLSFFNDAAGAIAATRQAIESYATRLGLASCPAEATQVTALPQSGYIRVADNHSTILLDVGPVGPDYLPGHAHADTLSFEWSLFGHRVVVNGGTSCYGTSDERIRQRSTSAHSTVEINGMDSSEVWGGFRVARRAYPFDLAFEENGQKVHVSCAHDGYMRLPGSAVHWRQLRFAGKSLRVTDRVVGGGLYVAVARYHFHPSIQVASNGNSGQLIMPEQQVVAWQVLTGDVRLLNSSYHPEFGLSLPCLCLEIQLVRWQADILFTWG